MTVALAFPADTRGQDPGTEGSKPGAQSPSTSSQDARKSGDASSKDPNEAVDSTAPASSTVNAIGTASPLGTPNGYLRWGDFFVRDVSFTQIYDHSNYFAQSLPTFSGRGVSNSTSLFQTTFVFNHVSRNNQIAVQYQPRLAIINGSVYPDYSNQNANLDWSVTQNARWSVNFHDSLSYFSSQNLYALTYADANPQTGAAIQNNFLNGPGAFLDENASITFSYRWTPRTTLSFAPRFAYMFSTGSARGTLTSKDYGGDVALNYQLSPRQTIGAFFNTQYVVITGFNGNSEIYSMGLSYSRQMGPAWMVSATGAATSAPGSSTTHPWTFSGNASLTRAFRGGSAGIVYTRDLAMGYVTNHFADRIDAVAKWQLASSIMWSASGGYQRESGVAAPISAYYTTTEFDVRLAPRVTVFANYGYRLQNGNANSVLNGHGNFVSGGIRWASSPSGTY
jgi:hypothetical protein